MSEEKLVVAVDSQKISMMQTCECKHNYIFELHYAAVEQSTPLEKGSLIHDGFEYWYGELAEGREPKVEAGIAAMEQKALNMSLPLQEVEDTIKVFKEYVEFWGFDRSYQFLRVEKVGSRLLYEDDDLAILYETKIDIVARLRQQDIVIPWDTKTYSRKSPINPLENQFVGYVWMLDARNILINRVGFQKTLTPKEKFVRIIQSYPTPVIEQWKRNTIFWVKRILENQQSGFWAQNFKNCVQFNNDCVFLPLCRAEPQDRQRKAMQLFNITKAWDIGAGL